MNKKNNTEKNLYHNDQIKMEVLKTIPSNLNFANWYLIVYWMHDLGLKPVWTSLMTRVQFLYIAEQVFSQWEKTFDMARLRSSIPDLFNKR